MTASRTKNRSTFRVATDYGDSCPVPGGTANALRSFAAIFARGVGRWYHSPDTNRHGEDVSSSRPTYGRIFRLSYNIAYAVFGGITPVLVARLAHINPFGPAHFIACVGAVGLLGILFAPVASDASAEPHVLQIARGEHGNRTHVRTLGQFKPKIDRLDSNNKIKKSKCLIWRRLETRGPFFLAFSCAEFLPNSPSSSFISAQTWVYGTSVKLVYVVRNHRFRIDHSGVGAVVGVFPASNHNDLRQKSGVQTGAGVAKRVALTISASGLPAPLRNLNRISHYRLKTRSRI